MAKKLLGAPGAGVWKTKCCIEGENPAAAGIRRFFFLSNESKKKISALVVVVVSPDHEVPPPVGGYCSTRGTTAPTRSILRPLCRLLQLRVASTHVGRRAAARRRAAHPQQCRRIRRRAHAHRAQAVRRSLLPRPCGQRCSRFPSP